MQINQHVKIIVAEPWDFISPEGDNQFSGIVCEYTYSSMGEAYLIKNNIPFKLNGINISYVVAVYRNKNIDSKNLNIAYIPDDIIMKFKQLDMINDKIKFIIVGTLY